MGIVYLALTAVEQSINMFDRHHILLAEFFRSFRPLLITQYEFVPGDSNLNNWAVETIVFVINVLQPSPHEKIFHAICLLRETCISAVDALSQA